MGAEGSEAHNYEGLRFSPITIAAGVGIFFVENVLHRLTLKMPTIASRLVKCCWYCDYVVVELTTSETAPHA